VTITLKEARKLVRENGPRKYRGSVLTVLQKLVEMTFSPQKDDPHRKMLDRSANTVRRSVRVQERQFRKILDQLRDVLKYERHDGKIDYQLDLEPLTKLGPDSSSEAAAKKSRQYRTQWARDARTDKRSRLQDGLSLMIACGVGGGILPQSVFEKRTEPDVTESILDPHPGYYRKLHPEVAQRGQL
jgi:hypothetical protein